MIVGCGANSHGSMQSQSLSLSSSGGMARSGSAPEFIALEKKPSAAYRYKQQQQLQQQLYSRTKRKRSVECQGKTPEAQRNGDHDQDRSRLTPEPIWKPKGRLYAGGVVGLHNEIEDLFSWMMPTRIEHEARINVVNRVRAVIQRVWPDSKVDIFGSFKTGLYLPTSDIDLVICGRWPQLPIHTLHDELVESGIPRLDSLVVLDKAAIPIVKMTDHRTDIKVDISFNTVNGIRAAELIKFYKKTYPPLPKLIYVLKQFLLMRGLNEVFQGGLSSYALILMAVSFLQSHPRPEAKTHRTNIGVLLIEFFELYGRNFNYCQNAIRVRDGGGCVPRDKLSRQMFQACPWNPATGPTVCIEDPLNVSNNVGRGSFFFHRVKSAFEEAYIALIKLCSDTSADRSSILSHIVTVADDVKTFRSRLQSTAEHSDSEPSKPSYAVAARPKHKVMVREDPLTPVLVSASRTCDVIPTELPLRHLRQLPDEEVTDMKANDSEEHSDSMSGVSTTTTVSTVSSSSDSDGSPSQSGPTGKSLPSIGTARKPVPLLQVRGNAWRNLNNIRRGTDRADLDPDWRSGGNSSESSEKESTFHQKVVRKVKDNRRQGASSDSNRSSRQLHRADQDPDWRNHAEFGEGMENGREQSWKSPCDPEDVVPEETRTIAESRSLLDKEETQSDRDSGADEISNENYVNASSLKTRTLTKKRKKAKNKNGVCSSTNFCGTEDNSRFSSGAGQYVGKR